MFRVQNPLVSYAMASAAQPVVEEKQRALRVALSLYNRARTRAWLRRLWSVLTQRRQCLLDLSEVEKQCSIRHRHYRGIQTVCLDQIRGSDGRCRDFDRAFYPSQEHNRGRWLAIATLQESGTILPPVQLVQVGEIYFVQDGHHRISVARASGKACIEAEVVVWQVTGPLPWAEGTPAQPWTSMGARQAAEAVGSS
ncbi:MAG: hypothetical protein PVH11_07495 [Anaerolineae bacterium]